MKYVVFHNDDYGIHLEVMDAENWEDANTKAENKYPHSVLLGLVIYSLLHR